MKILIVEDNPGDACLFKEMLIESQMGSFELQHADRLSMGFDLIEKEKPDVVLLDLSLSDSSGLDTFLKLQEQSSGIPIIVLTGFDDEELAVKAVREGAQDYLVKGQIDGPLVARSIRYAIERKRSEMIIIHQAYHDPLTNLPNRILFNDRLKQGLMRTPWHKRFLGVLFLDLDNFKRVNDSFGHNAGDLVLKNAADRILSCLRSGDTLARMGGDEFGIVLADLAKEEDVSRIAQKIIDELSKPCTLGGNKFFTTTSIGISLFPKDGKDSEILLKNADMAMYRAKKKGRNNYQHFSPGLNFHALEKRMMEAAIRHALEEGQFFLQFQPQFDANSLEIIGQESLLRWNHPELGVILPDQFIPLAEESGLIVPIGEWVIRSACEQNKKWQRLGLKPIPVSVNISAGQLQNHRLVNVVESAIKQSGLDPQFLELEITEYIMQIPEEAIIILSMLKEIGIQFSIEDFGKGYSSLSYLQRFPIQKLKIPQCFVNDITTNSDNAGVVTAIISLARGLKLRTIAGGVETKGQFEFLKSLQCHEVQGFYFSPPLDPEDASRILAEGILKNS